MSRKSTPEFLSTRLREIDSLFATGGLKHSRRKRTAAISVSPARRKSGSAREKKSPGKSDTPDIPMVLRVPAWEQYRWLAHGFSARVGGVSTAYRPSQKAGALNLDLNLGMTAADSQENVLKNRELFLRAVLRDAPAKLPSAELKLMRQIHSGLVHCFVAEASAATPLRGDGAITAQPGKMLAIQTADCIPVLVADVRQRIVAAFHAGWRGTLARIVERGVGRMRAEFGSRPEDLTAAIGPGIGRCCYSVGEEVRMEFTSQFAYANELFAEVFDLDPIQQKYPMLFLTARAPGHSNLGPSIHLDLAEANRRQLLDAGLGAKNIHGLGLCTACDTKRFFSHRAEQGFTGRMLSVIGIADENG